jgi:hypothetical protein
LLGVRGATAAPGDNAAPELSLAVREVARTVDLAAGGRELLTLTVEVTGWEPGELRRVQPLREDFQLLHSTSDSAKGASATSAGPTAVSLRGGTAPDDSRRLRFVVGFPLPPPETRGLSLRARLPAAVRTTSLSIQLPDLRPGSRDVRFAGGGWSLTVTRFAEEEYFEPALPPLGKFGAKGGPMDLRVFRRSAAAGTAPPRALRLQFRSETASLYDRTLELDGSAGAGAPLLSGYLRRVPSRIAEKPGGPVQVTADLYFKLPASMPSGVELKLLQQSEASTKHWRTVTGIPVPGASRR